MSENKKEMKPELVYVITKDIINKEGFKEFNFSNDFKIDYKSRYKKFSIKDKREVNKLKSFWTYESNNLLNINLLVGENGSGKTTLFDLLTLPRDKRRELARRNEESGMLAIYHIEDDIFVFEGYRLNLFIGIDGCCLKRKCEKDDCYLKKEYDIDKTEFSIIIKYDLDKKDKKYEELFENGYIIDRIQVNEGVAYSTVILSLDNTVSKTWLKEDNKNFSIDQHFSFKRQQVSNNFYGNIYKLLWGNSIDKDRGNLNSFEELIYAEKLECNINIKEREYHSTEVDKEKESNKDGEFTLIRDIIWKNKFNLSKEKKTLNFPYKEGYILYLLEELILMITGGQISVKDFESYIENMKDREDVYSIKTTAKGYLDIIKNCNEECKNKDLDKSFEERKKYLLDILYGFNEKSLLNENDYLVKTINDLEEILEKIGSIEDKYFKSYKEIEIKMDDTYDKEIYRLLKTYNDFISEHRSSHIVSLIEIHFNNLSNGELQMIDVLASISNGMNMVKSESLSGIKTAILFLDEPDQAFHPEWSRRFIDVLVTFLKNDDSGINYQIFISTHSLFMVSDIPKEFIRCIRVRKEGDKIIRTIENSKHGYMSNYYEIIKDDFFLKSLVGEFARKRTDSLINDINKLNDNVKENEISRIKDEINLIGDRRIRHRLMDTFLLKIGYSNIDKEIEIYEEKIKKLKELKKGDDR